ncbi:MAG: hypothetical protein [Bacteriophage sp.]|nr:MAG: hypothetical protein [Bacteriophage sp.]
MNSADLTAGLLLLAIIAGLCVVIYEQVIEPRINKPAVREPAFKLSDWPTFSDVEAPTTLKTYSRMLVCLEIQKDCVFEAESEPRMLQYINQFSRDEQQDIRFMLFAYSRYPDKLLAKVKASEGEIA